MPKEIFETVAPSTVTPTVNRRSFGLVAVYPGTPRLFVGKDAKRRAESWTREYGRGSAMVADDPGLAPAIVWPAIAALRIEGAETIAYHELVEIVGALLRDGVGTIEVHSAREKTVTYFCAE